MKKLDIIFLPTFFIISFCLCLSVSPVHAKIKATQRPYVIQGIKYYPVPSSVGYNTIGKASWYGKKFHGRLTSNGERYNMHDMTAAHKTLPMHTKLLITNLKTNKQIVVRVNDRGPFVKGRVLDLSYGAAKKIGMANAGVMRVKIEAISDHQLKKDSRGRINYPDINKGVFFVQIGAFANKNNAYRLANKFKKYGHKAKVTINKNGKRTLYRVHIYAGHSLKKSKAFERSLEKQGYKGAFTIAK